jgi:hypothetical protein
VFDLYVSLVYERMPACVTGCAAGKCCSEVWDERLPVHVHPEEVEGNAKLPGAAGDTSTKHRKWPILIQMLVSLDLLTISAKTIEVDTHPTSTVGALPSVKP